LYYDAERGWTILKLEPGLELRLQEAYWGKEPKSVNGPTALTTSRATLISGSPDSLLYFQINTGTPTRGQIFAADQIIEGKIKMFAQIFGYQLLRPVGSGAEGCLYLAEKDSTLFYLKSPDGLLAQEEIQTVETLKRNGLIPNSIKTYAEDRMIVMPEFQQLPEDPEPHLAAVSVLLLRYLKSIWNSGYLCLDLTPDHVKIDPGRQMIFLIDFSGYTEIARFKKQPKELLSDRKKIEYRTPEETVGDFRDPEKFQIYLMGLLLYQLSREDHTLPLALQYLSNSSEYEQRLQEDLVTETDHLVLRHMLAFDPSQRKNFVELQQFLSASSEQIRGFWSRIKS
jgi:hypothetical protein